MIGLILAASALAILRRAMRDDLVDGSFAMDEQELGEALAERAAVLDPPAAGVVMVTCPAQRDCPPLRRICHAARATGLPVIVNADEGMGLLMRIDANVHPASLHAAMIKSGTRAATCLYGGIHTLPFSLLPGA